MRTPEDEHDPVVLSALASAATACRQVIVDYRSGLLDDAESTRALVRSGLVIMAGEAWLLDAETNRWWRYRGGAPSVAHEQRDAPGL